MKRNLPLVPGGKTATLVPARKPISRHGESKIIGRTTHRLLQERQDHGEGASNHRIPRSLPQIYRHPDHQLTTGEPDGWYQIILR
jgi:hypothetical protein